MKSYIRSIAAALAVVGLSCGSGSAFAGNGTVTFTGQITSNTCTVNGTATSVGSGPANLVVALPLTPASQFSGAQGDFEGATPFAIVLTNCTLPTGDTAVSLGFDQGANLDTSSFDPNALSNTAQVSPATGVDIAVFNSAGVATANQVKISQIPGSQNIPIVTPTTSPFNATFKFYAAYEEMTATRPTAGNVYANVTFTLTYQ